MTLDDRIRESLASAARIVEASQPATVADVRRASARRANVRRGAWAAIGVVAVVASALVVKSVESDSTVASVSDPDVIQGEISPPPQFDTDGFGTDVTLGEIPDVSVVVAEAAEMLETRGAKVTKVFLGGIAPSGEAVYTAIIRDEDNLLRCIVGACYGVDSLGSDGQSVDTVPRAFNREPTFMTSSENESTLFWEVSSGVSVAKLAVGHSQTTWQRPIGGLAYFEIEGGLDQPIVMTTFDDEGNVLGQYRRPLRGDGFVCPVTFPTRPDFRPPPGYPEDARSPANAWYGSADLWTVLPVDGAYQPRKSVWWSQNFPGGSEEEQPPINVAWTRLDDDSALQTSVGGTNARTAEDGDFMIAGIDPDEPGCWEVTAEYKGQTLRYVYERR